MRGEIISDNPASIISEQPNPSLHPKSSSVSIAALTDPITISKSIMIENKPAPILLGEPKIIILVGIWNNKAIKINHGIIKIKVSIDVVGPR